MFFHSSAFEHAQVPVLEMKANATQTKSPACQEMMLEGRLIAYNRRM